MIKIKMTFSLLFTLCFTLIVSCAGGAEAVETSDGTATFGSGIAANQNETTGRGSGEVEVKALNDVEGKEWILTELRSAGNTVRIDRSRIEAADTNGSFTINFQEGRVSGLGWPNRYFGPYTADSGETLSIGNLASTMMAAFIELDELKEQDYFAYLSKVTRWAIRDGKLELYSTSEGRETVLVFELK